VYLAGWSQEMLSVVRCRIICHTVCY